MPRMNLADGFAPHTGVIIAEVGFLLILFAGIWFVAAEIPALKASAARKIVAGVALALGEQRDQPDRLCPVLVELVDGMDEAHRGFAAIDDRQT